MSFAYIQKARYIFDIYWLGFVFISSLYGLLVDIKNSRKNDSERDAKIAKRIYITLMTLSVTMYVIVKLL